ncbi:MAG: hypothetical protein ABIC04_05895 [Nanoarchaeota archaeon]
MLKLLADKGYDANWLHRFCHEQLITSIIPGRDSGTKKILIAMAHTKRAKNEVNNKTHHSRQTVESILSAIKRK